MINIMTEVVLTIHNASHACLLEIFSIEVKSKISRKNYVLKKKWFNSATTGTCRYVPTTFDPTIIIIHKIMSLFLSRYHNCCLFFFKQ